MPEETLRADPGRSKSSRQDPLPEEALRPDRARQDARGHDLRPEEDSLRQGAVRQDASGLDPLREEVLQQDPGRQDARRQDQQPQDQQPQDSLQQQGATRQDALRQDPLPEEALQQDPMQQDSPRQEPLQQDSRRQEPLQDSLRQDTLRQDSRPQESLRPDSPRQELLRSEALRPDCLRQDLRQDPLRQDPAPAQSSRKRSPDDLSLLCELPPREAEAVGLALEQWGRLRQRVKALEPTLRREGALVQEILDTGLRDENRRTLRKLTQSSAGGDVEETIQQVGKAIGSNRERLERILERNHGELVRLSTTAVSDMKEDVLREVDEVLARLKRALAAVRGELLGAKERADMAAVRRTGRSFNDLKGLVRRLDEERRLITRNSALAALLVTVCRRVLPVRQVDPSALRDIPPSCEGYRRIMDFYFFTDAGLYFFGDYPSGPNWFVRLKRNVAILLVRDNAGRVLYNHFAVSGEHRAPGAPLAPDRGPLQSMEAEDEHGRVFNRQHDAEFKLLSGLCSAAAASSAKGGRGPSAWEGTGTLWSRKPLCASCLGAVRQVRALFPRLRLAVSVGAIAPAPTPAPLKAAASEDPERGKEPEDGGPRGVHLAGGRDGVCPFVLQEEPTEC